MKKYYKLTQDIKNPFRNKRCKYGVRGKEILLAGTIIEAFIYDDAITDFLKRHNIEPTPDVLAKLERDNASYYIDTFSFRVDDFNDLPTQEVNTLDAVDEFNTKYAMYHQDDMIREFLKKGIVKIEDIREYHERE